MKISNNLVIFLLPKFKLLKILSRSLRKFNLSVRTSKNNLKILKSSTVNLLKKTRSSKMDLISGLKTNFLGSNQGRKQKYAIVCSINIPAPFNCCCVQYTCQFQLNVTSLCAKQSSFKGIPDWQSALDLYYSGQVMMIRM